jgi:hypothetical protein
MSYMPKYILKRVFPADCIKLKDNGVEFTFNNVLAPMQIEKIPEGEAYLARYSIKVDGVNIPIEIMKKAKVTVNGKTYASTNIKALEGQVIPAGGKIVIFAPVTEFAGKKLKKGEEHEFFISIKVGDGDRKSEYGPLSRVVQ